MTHIAIEETAVPSAEGVQQRRRFREVLIAAGVMIAKSPALLNAQPLSAQERAALADRLALPGAKPLSEVIIEEREGR